MPLIGTVSFGKQDRSNAGPVLIAESVAAVAFLLFAVVGFKTRLWLVAAALVSHGVFDFVHQFIIDNPGVPQWWPGFCLAIDVVAGTYLATLLAIRSRTN